MKTLNLYIEHLIPEKERYPFKLTYKNKKNSLKREFYYVS